MKKLISLLLLLTLLTLSLAACKDKDGSDPKYPEDPFAEDPRDPSDKKPVTATVSGIDAVKLLLAEERLNEKLLKNDGDIFERGSKDMRELAKRAKNNLRVKHMRDTAPEGSLGEEKSGIGKYEAIGDTAYWSELGEVSNSYEYFINLTNNIVCEADTCADLIDFVKKYVRIVDKWVVIANERYYLSVGENEELLCYEREDSGSTTVIICRRYRNESGKDVYEMYHAYGADSKRRITYIPGERYELSENRNLYFVATNTKGYWENYVLGDVGEHYNVSYLIMKDDICYHFGFMQDGYTSIEVLSADRETDLFHYSFDEHSSSTGFVLKLNGFDNIESISAPLSGVELGESFAVLQPGQGGQINIRGGNTIREQTEYLDGRVITGSIHVMSYTYGYGAELMLNINARADEAFDILKQFLDETGLICRRNIDTVIAGAKKSVTDSVSVFDYYKWNGESVSTNDGIAKAITNENSKYGDIIAYYTAIKNKEAIALESLDSAESELQMSFAPISALVSSDSKLIGNRLLIGSIELTVNDMTLFVKDEAYRAVIALADESGAIVHLEQVNTTETAYTGTEQLTVSASNLEITLPILAVGSYRVVAYIATSDGIRSSGYHNVSFDAAESIPANLGDADLNAAIENGTLTLQYAERADIYISLESDTALGYEDFKRLLGEAAFEYGIPGELIEVNGADGFVVLDGTESEITAGNYRIEYTAENGTTVKSGHVYVALTINTISE